MALAMKDMPGIYGDSYKYGPILTPDPARLPGSGTVTLGEAITTWNVSAPGLVLKEFGRGGAGNGRPGLRGDGDYAVVFSAAIPLPAPLLRSLAHYGGCNVWVNSDAVVMASDSVVAVHSTEPGPVTLNFPRRMKKVTDAVTGNVVAVGVTSLQLDITPPETRVFFTE
jgi:hypothetical protein